MCKQVIMTREAESGRSWAQPTRKVKLHLARALLMNPATCHHRPMRTHGNPHKLPIWNTHMKYGFLMGVVLK
jgi:hypothetical protein